MATKPATPSVANPLDDHIGYQLRRASSIVMAELAEGLSAIGLTIVESSVLVLINSNPGIFQSEIGRALAIKRANVAPIVAMLERRGLIGRSASDGRQVGLATTDAGRDRADRAEQIMRDNDERLFAALPEQQRALLRGMLAETWKGQPVDRRR